MLIDTYNQKGEKTGQTKLPKEIFDIPLNSDLVHQVAVSQMANRRRIIAHTKTRGEVRGGGKKPWRQKGTGRARHGSSRSPIWRAGGITFGPRKDKVFKKIIPKKIRRKALFMVLSSKVKDNSLILLEDFKLKEVKTKLISEIFGNLPVKDKSGLVAIPEMDKNIILSARNISKIQTIQAKELNVLDLLSSRYLIMPKESIKVIQETFLKNAEKKTKSEK